MPPVPPAPRPAAAVLADALSALRTLPAQRLGPWTLVPLAFDARPLPPPHLGLSGAMADGGLAVTETSEAGAVPELRVANGGALPVLLLDGEEIVGAKQNRIVNVSVLVPAGGSLVLPVSCTEAGRWRRVSDRFADGGTLATPRVRRAKHARRRPDAPAGAAAAGDRPSAPAYDQGAVWREIDQLYLRSGERSATGALRDLYAAREEELAAAAAATPRREGQVGLAVLRAGRVVSVDVVARPEVYAGLHEKLVRSCALEAHAEGEALASEAPGTEASDEAPQTLEAFLAALSALAPAEEASRGLGTELRYEAEDRRGRALVWQDALVHLTAHGLEAEEG